MLDVACFMDSYYVQSFDLIWTCVSRFLVTVNVFVELLDAPTEAPTEAPTSDGGSNYTVKMHIYRLLYHMTFVI